MATTSKGRVWEILHSLWILWTFTLGLFSWVAFFYIGIRARQRKWILWGLIYSIPFIFAMATEAYPRDSWIRTSSMMIAFALGAASIIHAFLIRKEYLLRLEALQSQEPDRTAALKSRVQREYSGKDTRDPAPSQSATRSQLPASSNREKEKSFASPSRASGSTSSVDVGGDLIDLNSSSGEELAMLPGVGVIIAKRAVSLRKSRGGFHSVEDFGQALSLKPHVVERIRPLVSVSPSPQYERHDPHGRIVDF